MKRFWAKAKINTHLRSSVPYMGKLLRNTPVMDGK